jgi:multidrug transporter EmrE-like cation transporter
MTRNVAEGGTSPFVAAGVTVILTVYGQGVVKWRVDRAGEAPDGIPQQLTWALELLLDPWIWTVVIAVIAASIAWLAAISRLELSIVYPLMSTSLILVVLLGVLAFDEPLTIAKIGGAVLVLVGLVIANWPSAAPTQAGLGGDQGA